MKAKDYEEEAATRLKLASIAMKKDNPNYGEAENQIAKAQTAIKYARQINNGTYRGEEW